MLTQLKIFEHVKIIHVGKGARIQQIALQQGLQNKIHITGYLETTAAYQYLSATDLFCLLHADIRGGVGFKSGSLAAAFYCGLPVMGCMGTLCL